jgi:hypothetical protein
MKQTRQTVRAIMQSIFLDVYGKNRGKELQSHIKSGKMEEKSFLFQTGGVGRIGGRTID